MTGLTIAQADVRLSKNAGADAQKNDATSAAHEGDGFYMCELDATDTATVGTLTLWVHVATALAVRHDFQVIEEAVYDQLYGASALGYIANAPVNVAQISGDSTAADNLETVLDDTAGPVPWVGIVDQGTTQSITGTGAVLRSAAAFPNDVLIGMVFSVLFNGSWQFRVITDNALSGDTITFDALSETPTGTLPYKIWGAPPVASNAAFTIAAGGITNASFANDAITAAKLHADVTTELQSGLATAAALTTVDGIVDDILLDTAEIGTAGAGLTNINLPNQTMDIVGNITGNLSGSVGTVTTVNGLAANVITAAATAADFTTEIQAGLATAAALATVDGLVDTLIAAVINLATTTGAVTTDGGNSATSFETNLAQTVDDYWKDSFLLLTSGALVGQQKKITAYNGTTKIITVQGGFTATPADAVTFAIVNR